MLACVDDMLQVASPEDTTHIWRALDKKVKFKDPEEDISRYLGARYRLDPVDRRNPTAPRTMTTDMDSYVADAVNNFVEQERVKLSKVTSPYLSNEECAKVGEPGAFASSCGSYVATLLL